MYSSLTLRSSRENLRRAAELSGHLVPIETRTAKFEHFPRLFTELADCLFGIEPAVLLARPSQGCRRSRKLRNVSCQFNAVKFCELFLQAATEGAY